MTALGDAPTCTDQKGAKLEGEAGAPGPGRMGPPMAHTCRLLPTLLPSHQITADSCGQLWNIDPAHDQEQTALDDAPTPTDQKVGGSSPSERAQVRGPLPDSEGAFLLLLGATLGATGTCQPPNRALLIGSAAAACHLRAGARTRARTRRKPRTS